ncbi:glycosyltransferase [Conexibacter sp. DBS9H8]|uniref:UDP-N-acetylglucosamine--N-acetylmuramyl- (pentapeptide) pyrophosphoryl-undecaprenol N-acetylglucosamine transferase n=1 Tax=Conexibacter sp. DBS9H8 TaxID=2937801 RepID=UPI00200F9179|nr:UDP-N-acetylglucosamine--N-acetylmuramyl-(pentapeptide) pyrophosphoryl-undecaprenol N-acetylglucosamine transferase [Conexibacter sp. DBS9H8]
MPALAVADALSAEGADVIFVGGDRQEVVLVPEAGYPFHGLRVVSLPRRDPLRVPRAVAIDARALVVARQLLRDIDPDVVLGGGGYVAGPVGLAACLQGRPLVLTEIDSHLGLTNRLLAPFAQRICLGLPIPGRSGARYVVTGRPLPAARGDRAAGRARFGVADAEVLIVVCGGSLGAASINGAALKAFAEGSLPGVGAIRVLHAAGERDLPSLTVPGPFYDLRGYVPNLVDALAAADLVISRSGGSIFEIAAAGVPSILIPSPNVTGDHQTPNARWLVDAGGAVLLPDDELTPQRLAAEATTILADGTRRANMAAAAAGRARPGAATAVAAEVLSLAHGSRRPSE